MVLIRAGSRTGVAEVEDYAQGRRVQAKRKTVSCFGRASDATRGRSAATFSHSSAISSKVTLRERDLHEASRNLATLVPPAFTRLARSVRELSGPVSVA